MPFNNVKDGLYKLALAGSGYTHASSTTITLGSGLGASMPSLPYQICLVKATGYGTDTETMRAFDVSNRSSDTLTLAIASGYTDDTDFSTSDYVELRVLAKSTNDLNTAVASLQVMTTTGDMIYSSSGSTPARLAVGSAYQVLASVSGVPTYLYGCVGKQTLTSNTTLTASSPSINMLAPASTMTITLPDPATCDGKEFWFYHTSGLFGITLSSPSGNFHEVNSTSYTMEIAGNTKKTVGFLADAANGIWITLRPTVLQPRDGGTGGSNGSITIGGICHGSTIGVMAVTPAGTVGQTLISNANNTPFWASAPYVVATVTGIDGKSVASTNLFTVPTGRTLIVTGAVVRCSAASSITVPADAGIGVSGSDVIASTTLTSLTATAAIFRFNASGASVSVAAASIVKFNVTTGATGTSQTLVVDLLGYLL